MAEAPGLTNSSCSMKRSSGESKAPARPGFMFERFDPRCSIGMNDIGCVALRRNRKTATLACRPRHRTHLPAPRVRRAVWSRSGAAHGNVACGCPRPFHWRIRLEPVRFDPLGVGINWIHAVRPKRRGTGKTIGKSTSRTSMAIFQSKKRWPPLAIIIELSVHRRRSGGRLTSVDH